MNAEVLKMMQCPVSGSALEFADDQLVQKTNELVAAGTAESHSGESVSASIDGGLVNADRSLLVPARGKIYCFNIESLIKIK